jgi:hypothetical protein
MQSPQTSTSSADDHTVDMDTSDIQDHPSMLLLQKADKDIPEFVENVNFGPSDTFVRESPSDTFVRESLLKELSEKQKRKRRNYGYIKYKTDKTCPSLMMMAFVKLVNFILWILYGLTKIVFKHLLYGCIQTFIWFGLSLTNFCLGAKDFIFTDFDVFTFLLAILVVLMRCIAPYLINLKKYPVTHLLAIVYVCVNSFYFRQLKALEPWQDLLNYTVWALAAIFQALHASLPGSDTYEYVRETLEVNRFAENSRITRVLRTLHVTVKESK